MLFTISRHEIPCRLEYCILDQSRIRVSAYERGWNKSCHRTLAKYIVDRDTAIVCLINNQSPFQRNVKFHLNVEPNFSAEQIYKIYNTNTIFPSTKKGLDIPSETKTARKTTS